MRSFLKDADARAALEDFEERESQWVSKLGWNKWGKKPNVDAESGRNR